MPDLGTALTIFGQVVSYKRQYEQLHAEHPTWAEGGPEDGNILGDLHSQAVKGEAWLSDNGFSTAAGVLSADNADAASAWLAANPDLDTGLSLPQPGLPGGSGAGAVPVPALQGVRDAWGVLADWVNNGASQAWYALQAASSAVEG